MLKGSKKKKLKRKYVHHRKTCSCMVSPMGYTTVVQLTLSKDCPFHKHYITKE